MTITTSFIYLCNYKNPVTSLAEHNHVMALSLEDQLIMFRNVFHYILIDRHVKKGFQTHRFERKMNNAIFDYCDREGQVLDTVCYCDLTGKLIAWEKYCDMKFRREVFEKYRILSYKSGYIAGRSQAVMADSSRSYEMWQEITFQNLK